MASCRRPPGRKGRPILKKGRWRDLAEFTASPVRIRSDDASRLASVAVTPEETVRLSHESILAALAAHEQALEQLRYGSFRGVVKGGKLVLFAIEQEWRPEVERRREMR